MRGKGGVPSPVLLALLAVLLLVSVPVDAGAQPRVPTGVYRRALGHDPRTLDPARISDIYSLSVAQQVFDGLVQYDPTLTITPALAEFWRASRDGRVWTFNLRRGVKFHHGREVTSEDVVYSLTRILDPKVKSGSADLLMNVRGAREFREGRATSVAGLVALDRHTVQVTLSEALAPFVAILAVGHAKIVPKDLAEAQGDAFGGQPVGTGAFRFVHWERGKEIVLAANTDYFDAPPRISQLVFRIFPGEQRDAMYEEFQKGNLEDSPVPAWVDRRAIDAARHTYVKRAMISVKFYGFNTRVKPLGDRRVRQAILHAVNREALIEDVYRGRFTYARGILPPGTLGFNPRLSGYRYDPQRARELLAEAGYGGGRGLPPLVIWSGAKRDIIVREHEEIKRQLAAVGITAEIRYLTDWPAFSRMLDEGKLAVFMYGWYADLPDPDNFLFKLFYSRGPRNFFGYANPTVDELLLRARSEQDLLRRVEHYRRAEQLILEDAPIMPVFHHTYERVFQSYVRSVEVNGLGDPYVPFRKVWLERPQ